MKAVLIFLAIGAAVALRPNTKLSYRYETEVLSGVPHYGLQYAGAKVVANVDLVTTTSNTVTIKITQVSIFKIETELRNSTIPREMFPDSALTPLQGDIVSELEHHLQKPCQFSYNNGRVSNIKMDPSDPLYSVNLKKGLIAKFVMQLRTGGSGDMDLRHEFKTRSQNMFLEQDSFESLRGDGQVYQTMEVDPSGECDTLYSLKQTGETIKVTKTKNMDDCVTTPVFEHGLLSGLTMMPEVRELQKTVEKESWTDCNIKGTPSSFVIEKLEQYSRYRFTPISPEDGSAVTVLRQRMQLMNLDHFSDSDVIAVGPLSTRPSGLLYEFPRSKGSLYWDNDNMRQVDRETLTEQEKISMVESLVQELISKTGSSSSPSVSEDAVELVKDITRVMRSMKKTTLQSLCDKHVTIPSSISQTGEVIVDLLPTIQSPTAVKVMAKLITEKKISSIRALISLKTIALTVTPDAELIKIFLDPTNSEFLAHPSLENSPMVKEAALMAAGVMKKRWLKKVKKAGVYSVEEALEKIDDDSLSSKWESLYHSAPSTSRKLVILKAIANTASIKHTDFLINVARNKAETESLRKVAIAGLKKVTQLSKDMRKKAVRCLITIYKDMSDSPMLRMTAFVVLMDCHHDSHVIDVVLSTQMKESSKQVGSFVYSYMTTLSKAKLPGLRESARNITKKLDSLAPYFTNMMTDSKAYHYDTYSEEKNLGISAEILKMHSGDYAVPSAFISRVMLHGLKKTVPAIEVGVHGKGIADVLYRAFGSHTTFSQGDFSGKSLREIIEAILVPLQSGSIDLGSVADEVRSIVERLGISERGSYDKLTWRMWLSLFGNDMSLVHITAEDIINAVRTGELPIIGNIHEVMSELTSGKRFDIIKVINPGRSSLTLPTPAGLPVSLNLTGTAILRASGDIQTPSNVLGIVTTIKSSMKWVWRATLGCDLFPLKTGVVVKGSGKHFSPLSVAVGLDRNTKKLITSFEIVDGEADIVNVKITPGVYVTQIDTTKMVKNRISNTRPLQYPSRVELVEATIPAINIPALNLKIAQKYLNPNSEPAWMNCQKIFAPSAMTIIASPMQRGVPVDIEVSMSNYAENFRQYMSSRMYHHSIFDDTTGCKARKYVVTAGPRRSNTKAVASLTVLSTPDMSVHQVFTHIALPAAQNYFKLDVMLNLASLSPSHHRTLTPSEVVGMINLGISNKEATVKLYPSQNRGLSWNRNTQNNFYALIDLITERPTTVSVVSPRTPKETSEMNYNFIVETNINSEDISKTQSVVATALVTYVYTKIPNINIPNSYWWRTSKRPGSIMGQLTLQPFYQNADVVVVTPSGWQYALHVPVYLYKPTQNLITIFKPTHSRMQIDDLDFFEPYNYAMNVFSGKCRLFPTESAVYDNFETFDGMSYRIKNLPNSCEVLLAKDCAQPNLFTLTMKTVEQGKKILNVLLPNHKVELLPVRSWLSASSGVTVKVDSIEQSISESEPIVISTRQNGYIKLYKRNDRIVMVSSTGVTVSTNGQSVSVKINPLMSKRVCGTCGNYNGDTIDDLEGPDMFMRSNPEHMFSSYMLNSDSCNADTVMSHFGIKQNYETCNPIEKTIIKERSDEQCFSTRPVLSCPAGCRPTNIRSVEEVAFTCKHKESDESRYYFERSRMEPFFNFNSEFHKDSFYSQDHQFQESLRRDSIHIPESCEPNY